MIVGIGTDLLDARRIERILERYPMKFIARIALPPEQAFIQARLINADNQTQDRARHYAKLYAAKEAILKAIGTGLAKGIQWHHIEIKRTDLGQPYGVLTQGAKDQLVAKGIQDPQVHLSLSDEWPYVQAFAVITTGHGT